MEDTDLMPFGKFKDSEMQEVPAQYLLWLHRNSDQEFRAKYPQVFEYIDDCMQALEEEVK